jgi:hypothetical protein
MLDLGIWNRTKAREHSFFLNIYRLPVLLRGPNNNIIRILNTHKEIFSHYRLRLSRAERAEEFSYIRNYLDITARNLHT